MRFIMTSRGVFLRRLYLNCLRVIFRAQDYYCLSGTSMQVWVGVDFHLLLNDTVICVDGVSAAEARRTVVTGNCCAERLGIMLGWTARCRPALLVFPFLSYPFTLPLSFALPPNCPL